MVAGCSVIVDLVAASASPARVSSSEFRLRYLGCATNFAAGTIHAAAAYIRYFRSTIGRWLELIGGNEAFQNLGAM